MDINKDYYSILGVLPSVELIVIKAAYKAMVQLYHPDRYSGDDAHKKMTELNEAYSVLSDPSKKKEYDSIFKAETQKNNSHSFDGFEEQEPTYDPLKADWDIVVEYYPDIEKLEKRLSKISWKLGYSYKAYLMESKLFDDSTKIANKLEQEFLKVYFGENPLILEFAKELIELGNKSAASELNKAIKILGNNPSNAKDIVNRIKIKFDLYAAEQKNTNIEVKCRTELYKYGYKLECYRFLDGHEEWLCTKSSGFWSKFWGIEAVKRFYSLQKVEVFIDSLK